MSAPSSPGFDGLHESAIRIQDCSDLPRLLDTVEAELKSLLGAEHVLVYLYDARWKDLCGRRSPAEDETRFPVGQGIAGLAVERGKSIHSRNAPEERSYVAEIDSPPEGEANAALAVPMFDRDGTPLGVFEALASRDEGFGDDERAAARLMARHVGIALARAREREREKRFVLDLAGALAGAVDRLSLSTVDHTWRVREYCRRLADAAGLDEDSRYTLETAAVLHDFGRAELEIREQSDGTLDAAAIEAMKPHVLLVEALLRNVPFPERLAGVPEIILCHHEFLDGSGYPNGKPGDEIPRLARMLAVADSYDACLYGRRPKVKTTKSGRFVPGAQGSTPAEDEAIEYLKRGAGKLFDAQIVRLFIEHQCHAIEQRRFPRIEFEAPVEVTVMGPGGEESRRFETQALDMSEGGILFRASEPLPPHTLVRLVVSLPSEKVEAIAKVARILPPCLGAEGDGKRIGAYFLWYGTRG
jgi:HD-GYP domain-containing protein (c-di-GMP phosphodiesterase class II)